MSDYDTSALDETHDGGGYESGYDGPDRGYEGEQHGLSAAHAEQGDDSDRYQNFNAFGAEHEEERDEHFKHIRQVEYSDGKGGYYKVTDITTYDVHEESSDEIFGQNYTEANHEESYNELETLRERFISEISEIGEAIGYGRDDEGGQQALSEVSN
jgi:hypothetical protein